MLVSMAPRAYRTGGAPIPTALSILSGVVMSRMGYVSYHLRHHGGIMP